MAKLLKLRRGTTSEHNSFTGAEGEVTVDTTKDTLVVHDGSTQGGVALAKESDNLSLIDEDDMATNSATRPPSQQSVKAYADTKAPAILDEDNLGSDSATRPPSQQSVKAYVDGQTLTLIDEDNLGSDSATRPPSQQSVKAYIDTNFAPKASPALTGTATGVNLTLSGNLVVNGTTTTVASSTMTVADKNIEIAKGAANDAAADGGGITLESGDGNKTITWVNATDYWTFNQGIETTAGEISIKGAEGAHAYVYISADEGDDNADQWRLQAASDGVFTIGNYSTGSWVNSITIDGSNNATVAGDLINNHLKRTSVGDMYVGNAAQGDLYIYVQDNTNNSIVIQANTGEKYIEAKMGSSVDLYHHGTKKIETTSSGCTISGNADVSGTVTDSKGDLRKIIQNTQSSTYTLVAADAGKHILASGNITVPDSVFSAGDAVTIINNTGSDLTITKGTNMYNAGDASNANRTLATRGMATLLFTAADTSYISGAGLS